MSLEAVLPLEWVGVWIIFLWKGDPGCTDNLDFKNSLQNSWAHVKYIDLWVKNFKSPSTRKSSNAKELGKVILKHYWSSCFGSSLVPFILSWLHHYSWAASSILPWNAGFQWHSQRLLLCFLDSDHECKSYLDHAGKCDCWLVFCSC